MPPSGVPLHLHYALHFLWHLSLTVNHLDLFKLSSCAEFLPVLREFGSLAISLHTSFLSPPRERGREREKESYFWFYEAYVDQGIINTFSVFEREDAVLIRPVAIPYLSDGLQQGRGYQGQRYCGEENGKQGL
ncbi:hypothetical protein Nepgr_030289 [Nepenthes gracilis]|uniref:Uncharacterized protein n=1 Tax=Nepenthes gracilis TaxID=150966 RepID=A0AAD3TGF0_NEPGR|nr:hypothetical protein Nepgr_030289 [Nepenthes gracilis]